MSRIGRKPIELPTGVSVEVKDNVVTVKGPKGTLSRTIEGNTAIEVKSNEVILTRSDDEKETKAKHGLYRALIQNMVTGVNQGFEKSLLFNGIGYKLQKTGNKLVMNIGLSHSVTVEEVPGVTLEVANNNEVIVKGIDKELVGQVAAKIRAIKPVEPYHMYGIRYKDEVVIRKVGKSAGKK